MRPKHKTILISLFVLVLAAAGIGWYIFNDRFTDTAEEKAEYTVNAMDLIREFQQNDSLANKKYTEQIININGIISEIEAADTTVNIKMSDSGSGDYIIFAFQQQHLAEAKTLKKGQQVSIKGSCSGGIYSEILETRYISIKRAALDR